MDGRRCVVRGGWWVVGAGWWLVGGGWWVVGVVWGVRDDGVVDGRGVVDGG